MDIKDMRIKAGLSRRDLCTLCNIPYRTLQSWELGDRKPPEYILELIREKIESLDK